MISRVKLGERPGVHLGERAARPESFQGKRALARATSAIFLGPAAGGMRGCLRAGRVSEGLV